MNRVALNILNSFIGDPKKNLTGHPEKNLTG
jgi:hypothetical protein